MAILNMVHTLNLRNYSNLQLWLSFPDPAQKHINFLLYYVPLISRSEEHTSELQSHSDLVCRLLLEKKKNNLKKKKKNSKQAYR